MLITLVATETNGGCENIASRWRSQDTTNNVTLTNDIGSHQPVIAALPLDCANMKTIFQRNISCGAQHRVAQFLRLGQHVGRIMVRYQIAASWKALAHALSDSAYSLPTTQAYTHINKIDRSSACDFGKNFLTTANMTAKFCTGRINTVYKLRQVLTPK